MKSFLLKTLYVTLFFVVSVQAQEQSNGNDLFLRIDNYLTQCASHGYSGSILVAKNGNIILSEGYGWADRSLKIKNTSSTVFNIGSVTKQFTAAAILKLMEHKKLDVSDNIKKYFPQASPDKQDITIHQLLTHTSGVSPRTGGFRYDMASKETFLKEFFQAELLYAPGTKHTYANANYIMLAAIIEKVSSQDYESYLRENFWEPLQMNRTGYKAIAFGSEALAHGYYFQYTDGIWKDWGTTQNQLPPTKDHWYSIGKGDIYSTVEDLYKWHMALENNKVLSAETKKLMETAHTPENAEKTSFYGYGWAIFNTAENTKIVAHNGSNGIYFADFVRYIDDELVVIALSNIRLNQQSENIAWNIAATVLDNAYRPQVVPQNTYELVVDFMKNNSTEKANQLPQFIESKTGSPLADKAILNRIGFNHVAEKKDTKWGIALLQLNTKMFPNDGNLWDSLGEAYYLLNDTDHASESFEKALELRPENNCHWCENSKNRLSELSTN